MRRKKFLIAGLAVSFAVFALTACAPRSAQETVSAELGIDVSGGEEISRYDTHSGNGDGTSCVAIRFEDDTVLREIKDRTEWKAFPLDETVQTLVYGVSDETGSVGPFLCGGDGRALVPEIKNGYYLLIDRHWDTETELLQRYSFNFTVGLYDADTNILYFCEVDT